MVPAEGFEPPTYGLQNRCTTTVLSRHYPARILPRAAAGAMDLETRRRLARRRALVPYPNWLKRATRDP